MDRESIENAVLQSRDWANVRRWDRKDHAPFDTGVELRSDRFGISLSFNYKPELLRKPCLGHLSAQCPNWAKETFREFGVYLINEGDTPETILAEIARFEAMLDAEYREKCKVKRYEVVFEANGYESATPFCETFIVEDSWFAINNVASDLCDAVDDSFGGEAYSSPSYAILEYREPSVLSLDGFKKLTKDMFE